MQRPGKQSSRHPSGWVGFPSSSGSLLCGVLLDALFALSSEEQNSFSLPVAVRLHHEEAASADGNVCSLL